jgi:hypothetical protein
LVIKSAVEAVLWRRDSEALLGIWDWKYIERRDVHILWHAPDAQSTCTKSKKKKRKKSNFATTKKTLTLAGNWLWKLHCVQYPITPRPCSPQVVRDQWKVVI